QGATGSVVRGNNIGVDKNGTVGLSPQNTGFGIDVNTNDTNITIGGAAAGDGNILGSRATGIGVGGHSTGIGIVGNRILSTVGIGIDLGENGVTPNDPGDADVGGNNLQNFPVLSTVQAGRPPASWAR